MKLVYLEGQDKYIDLDSPNSGVYTDADLDFLLQLESEHRKNLPTFSFYQLIEMFPTAKNAARRGAIQKIKEINASIDRVCDLKEMYLKEMEKKMDFMEYDEFKKMIEEDIEKQVETLQEEKQKYEHQRKFLTNELKKEQALKTLQKSKDEEKRKKAEELLNKQSTPKDIDDLKIAKAKEVPISNFIKVRRDGKVNCFYHTDKTPSCHIYKRKNDFHCFSCGRHGTVIDVVMALQGLDFKEAVKYLNNL